MCGNVQNSKCVEALGARLQVGEDVLERLGAVDARAARRPGTQRSVTATTAPSVPSPMRAARSRSPSARGERPLLPARQHELHLLDLRGQVGVAQAGPVRARGQGAAERLGGDVAQVRQREPVRVERVAERRERDAGLDPHEPGGAVGVQHAVQPVEREQRVAGQHRAGERVPAARHPDLAGRGHGGGHLGAAARPQ